MTAEGSAASFQVTFIRSHAEPLHFRRSQSAATASARKIPGNAWRFRRSSTRRRMSYYSIVLNIGTRADDYTIDVATQHCAKPNARFCPKNDVPNHGRAGNNPCCRMESGTLRRRAAIPAWPVGKGS